MGTDPRRPGDGSGETSRSRFARRLQELRRASGLSLRQMERRVHVSDSSLSRYLTGAALPPWNVVEALCRLAGADPEETRMLWERARERPGERLVEAGPTADPREADKRAVGEHPAGEHTAGEAEPPAGNRHRRRRDALMLAAGSILGLAVGLAVPPIVHAVAAEVSRMSHRPPPANPLVHDNPASGPAGRFDYVTDPYVRTKTQPGEFRITLRDSPSGWLCVKLVDSGSHRILGRPECVNDGETKVMVPDVRAVTKFQVAAMSGADGQYHGSMYY